MEYALQKQKQQGPPLAAPSVSITFVFVVAHDVLNIFSKAYGMQRSSSPVVGDDSQITVRRHQNAKQSSVCLVARVSSQDLTIHFAVFSHATADERFAPPCYHTCAERNSSVVEVV